MKPRLDGLIAGRPLNPGATRGNQMARGGYRPGAGRPKLTEAEKAARRAAKASGEPAKKATVKKSAPKKRASKAMSADVPKIPVDVTAEAVAADMDPLSYMLRVMRDPNQEATRRDRMAIAAAPFVHARKEAAGPGKREAAAGAAQKAAAKFKPSAPPLKLVANE